MTNGCPDRKDQLLEAALREEPATELAEHLKRCSECAGALAELQQRREQLDRLLPFIARGAELPADFRARVLSAAEATKRTPRPWRRWLLVGSAVAAAAVLVLLAYRARLRPGIEARLVPVEKIAQWRAPSDVFLETPGRQNLRTGPRLDDSIVNLQVNQKQED